MISKKCILNKINLYCTGKWKPDKKTEKLFLSNKILKTIIGKNNSMNTGKLSEWYVGKFLKTKKIKFLEQPVIHYTLDGKKKFLKPDFYIPKKDLFIEVKSRGYNCNGTASEKLDHIVRKYSKLELTDTYKKSKVLIICSAYELFEESSSELLNYNDKTSRSYIKDFVKLSKKYNILDWIPLSNIHYYL